MAEFDPLGILDDPMAYQRALAEATAAFGGGPRQAAQADPRLMALANLLRGGGDSQGPDAMPGGTGGQRAAGNLAMLTGDRVLAPWGAQQVAQAGQQQEFSEAQREARVGRALKLSMAAQQAAEDAARLKETERHNRAMEARPPPNILVPGQGGQYFALPTIGAPTATAVVDEQGNPVVKPAPEPPRLNVSDKEALEELRNEERALADLSSRFRPEYAGEGALGGLRTTAASMAGSWAPAKEQEAAAFWADFGRLIDLPARNKTFGASLSAGEKQSWESAKNIKRGSDPALVQRTFNELLGIVRAKMEARTQSLISEGYRPEAIHALTGRPDINLEEPPRAAPAAPREPQSQRPAAEPAVLTVPKGQKAVDLLSEGETRRIPMGGGQYRTVKKVNGKLRDLGVK